MASGPPRLVVGVADCPDLLLPTIGAAKFRLVGESATVGGARPTPVSGTFRGLCAELSRICRVADRLPTACGPNAMLNAQLQPTPPLSPRPPSLHDSGNGVRSAHPTPE